MFALEVSLIAGGSVLYVCRRLKHIGRTATTLRLGYNTHYKGKHYIVNKYEDEYYTKCEDRVTFVSNDLQSAIDYVIGEEHDRLIDSLMWSYIVLSMAITAYTIQYCSELKKE